MLFLTFWLSVAPNRPPSTPGGKFTADAKPPPGPPGGSWRNPTTDGGSRISDYPASFPHFVFFEVYGFPFPQIALLRLHVLNFRITRNRRQGEHPEADGSCRNPTEADGGHIPAYPTSFFHFGCRFLTFPAFRFSKSPFFDSGVNLRITRNHRQGNEAEYGGS